MTDERDHDEHADEQERAEAEALAQALERGEGAQVSQETLETAALLRAIAAPDVLSDDRSKAIYTALQPEVERRMPARRARGRVVGWIAGGLSIAAVSIAAAAVALLMWSEPTPRPMRPQRYNAESPQNELPAPRRELLAAQAALSAEDVAPEDGAAFEREMRAYRVTVLRRLKDSYPTQIGLLERGRAR